MCNNEWYFADHKDDDDAEWEYSNAEWRKFAEKNWEPRLKKVSNIYSLLYLLILL